MRIPAAETALQITLALRAALEAGAKNRRPANYYDNLDTSNIPIDLKPIQ